ncbi:hypothetical protein CO174_02175 [Candidatus Uhrbacteria bacterium CG_4_9_14_3_um_filter_50_9]|uniref:Uncharacterized protein n=1 Tax=Candidatus Uhrbacteria bacterium CG_4_9_14_3_um_filter_50_9 TaxID=1975035 RepID=A0A2M7XCL5_9BACT|nr:MAG: hypothetical protein CO174_02175 [Candidatus Uhrbacteria bacterium CG_4_9_14_3_um_filter_50_9]
MSRGIVQQANGLVERTSMPYLSPQMTPQDTIKWHFCQWFKGFQTNFTTFAHMDESGKGFRWLARLVVRKPFILGNLEP